jgi:hypothetical protein
MIKIREVEDKDLIPLADFLPRGFPTTTKEFWVQLFDFWWTSNPAYTPQIPRGWVLENDTTLVGFIGNIPVKFQVSGSGRIAVASNSWYVDPSVRGIFSLRLFQEYLKQKGASLFLFKEEDDENVMGILSRYKFEEHILPLSQKEYWYILDKKKVDTVIFKFLFTRKLPKVSELGELYKRIGFLIIAYLYQKPLIKEEVLLEEAYASSLCTSCDDAFSRLWEPHLKSCDITLSRDTKTLNWLYFSSARSYRRVVIQCHRLSDKTLAGYMVFDFLRFNMTGAENMMLTDMCIEHDDPRVLASLTSFAIDFGKQNNAVLLTVWANSPETEKYFRSTFTMRKAAHHYRYIRFSDAETMHSGKDTHGTVCLPMIYPPQ